MKPALDNLLLADIYGLTDEKYSLGRGNIEVVGLLIEAGVKVIQYREKHKQMREKYAECMEIHKITESAGVTFIVNDHVDLALLVGADGVHLGQDDLPVEYVRGLVGDKLLIGLSTHSPEQALTAVKAGADYIGVGPIFSTQTKADVCAPVGLEYLDYVAQHINIPYVTIGGIKEHHINQLRQHGAKCIAMVTELVGARDISQKVRDIRRKMQSNE